MSSRAFLLIGSWTLLAVAAQARLTPEQLRSLPAPATGSIQFAKDVQPILETACVKCHGRGKAKGGFSLETREQFLHGGDSGPAAVVGNSAASLFIEMVSGLDPDNVMPQKGSKLKPEQVGLLRAWVDQGMAWDAAVTFARRPPQNLVPRLPKLPPSRHGVTHPVDRIVDAYFLARHLKPGPVVDDRVFARRAYLDLLGVLPSPKELERFLADRGAGQRDRLIASILADNQRYAEHWLSFWNDLLRNDYSGTGYIDGGRKSISSWLYAALYTNAPYDRFVAELLNPSPASEGFAKGIVWRGVVNASQTPPMQAAQNVSQVFMGVNLKCASCHDSFINDWSLAESYSLANVYADDPLSIFQCDKPTGKRAGYGFIYPQLGAVTASAPKAARLKELASIVTQPANGRLTRTIINRLWARFYGRGLVEPVDDMEQPAWDQDLLDWLAEDFASHGYDLRHAMKRILTSRAYQLPAVGSDDQKPGSYVFNGPAVRRLSAEQFRDALGQLTGVWYPAPASGIDLALGAVAPAAPLPAQLRWIWSDAGAATAAPAETVYFWKSFVAPAGVQSAWAAASCDNHYTLYLNGKKVGAGKLWSEPNLLNLLPALRPGTNWLAVVAVNETPDGKAPPADAALAQASQNPAGFVFASTIVSAHATNRLATDASWIWSKTKHDGWEKAGFAPPDARAAAVLGPAEVAPWNLQQGLAKTLQMAKAHTDVRASLVSADPLTRALGRPPREQVVTTRASAATTLQALELTNGETLNQVLSKGAQELLASGPVAAGSLVDGIYARAFGRKPTAAERRLAESLLGEPVQREQVEDLLWAVTLLPEFQLIY